MNKHNQPLGLPKGSVRAIIALLVVLGSLGYFLLYGDTPDPVVGILGMIVGYYFGARQSEQ